MSYPSGGFPSQGAQQHQQPQQQGQPTQHFAPVAPQASAAVQASAPGGGSGLPIGLILALSATALGLVAYFLSFTESLGFGDTVIFLLVGGLLAALTLLPDAPNTLPFAGLFSVLGFLSTLSAVIEAPSVPGVYIVLLILSVLQALVAVTALLFGAGLIKLPAPKPAQPAYPAPGQYGQPQSGGFGQPGQYGAPPPQQAPPAQGPTTYAAQQGQFHQRPPSFGQEQQAQPQGFGQEQQAQPQGQEGQQ